MSALNVLRDSLRFFWDHYLSISFIILPVALVVELFGVFYTQFFVIENADSVYVLPLLLVYILTYPIYTGGVIFFVAAAVAGDTLDTKTCWRLGLKFWWSLLRLSILMGIPIILGFLLLIVPGLILLGRFSFAEFELLLRNHLPLDAMKNSWDKTKPHMWMILKGYVVIFVVLYGPYFALASVLHEFSIELGLIDNVLNMIFAVLGATFTIFAFHVYRLASEQLDPKFKSAP